MPCYRMSIWCSIAQTIPIRNDECPVCGYGQYSFYGKPTGKQAAALCGKDSVQVVPSSEEEIDFDDMASKLEPMGSVRVNAFTLDFSNGKIGIKLFRNGRAIIKNVTDTNQAISLYTKYIENSL